MAIRSVPDGDTAWGSDIRAVIARTNALTDDTLGTVPPAQLGTGTRNGTNYLRDDGVYAAPPGGGSGLPTAARTVYSLAPPAGLTAIAANGSTNDQANMQAHLNYVDSTWGAGFVIGSPGTTVKCNSGLTVPNGVQLRDFKFDFSAMASGTAITVNDNDAAPLCNVDLTGPGEGVTAATALSVTGTGCNFDRIQIRNFGVGVDPAHENTYIHRFTGFAIGDCTTCVYMDYAARGTVNAGERIVFEGGTFFNSPKIFLITNNQGGVFVERCSLDYSAVFGTIDNSHVFFTGCHMESTHTATPNDYLFNLLGNSRVAFTACNYILGSTGGEGLRFIINPASGPANYGSGRVMWKNCTAYFVGTSHSGTQVFSEHLTFVEQTATTVVFESPFISKWSPVSVTVAANAGDIQITGTTARVTITNSSGNPTGAVTVTASAAPGAGNYLPVRVEF